MAGQADKLKIEDLRVSRGILDKLFGLTEDQIRAQVAPEEVEETLARLATPEEENWMRIFKSTAPELERLQRRMSVCLDAEVIELTDEKVVYEFSGRKYEIKAPTNSFRVSAALEKSRHDAFAEMINQKCFSVDGQAVTLASIKLAPDEVNLAVRIAGKFFFLIYRE